MAQYLDSVSGDHVLLVHEANKGEEITLMVYEGTFFTASSPPIATFALNLYDARVLQNTLEYAVKMMTRRAKES